MTPWVTRLLIANVVVFVLQETAMPQLTRLFAFHPGVLHARPWTVVTYMFLHGGMTHLLFNMLTLYFFGPQVEGRLGERRSGQGFYGSVRAYQGCPPCVGAPRP